MGSKSQNLGFSLIELVVVVAVLSLLAASAFVGVGAVVPEFQMESAARRLAAAVANVRAEAALSGKAHGIVYDLDKSTYAVLAPPEVEEGEEEKPLDLEDLEELKARPLGRGVTFDALSYGERKIYRGRVKVYFGTVEPAAPHLLLLKGRDGLEYTVEVNPITGLVEVHEGHRDFDVVLTEEKFRRR